MSIIATSIKSEVPTSKPKTSVTDEQYDSFIRDGVKSRLFDYMEEGKKVTNQVREAVTKKVTALVSSEYRVKGSRSGHINHAPIETQKAYADAKAIIDGLTWTTNGIEYGVSLLAKKLVVND